MAQDKTRRWPTLLATLAVAAAASGPLAAQPEAPIAADAGYVYILPFYLSADANRRGTSEDGRGLAAGYGHPIGASRWTWEVQTFADLINVVPEGLRDFYRYGAGF